MFFELPYWSKLKLRHNLDVMHVEKNVLDTLVGTILDIEGKTKDTIKARLDLERMGIRRGLWMNRDSDKARRDLAFFSMKPNDKKEFLKFVSSVKFPDGYASNIARCVNVDGGFFSQLMAKTLQKTDMFQLRYDIVQVLCKFEMICPPAFFTSMMHVMVHLPEEALVAGPINYHWMYPIESARPFGDPGRGESFSRNDMEVNKLKSSNSPTYSDELYKLVFGPIRAELFSGCDVNNVKFLGDCTR
ncbi:unnamed protein product [Prunus armeniaca]